MTDVYPTSTVLVVTGTTERMLGHWRRRGWLTYTQEKPSPGCPITWTFEDILRIAVVKTMLGGAIGKNPHVDKLSGVTLDAEFLLVAPRLGPCTPEDVATCIRLYEFATVLPLGRMRDDLTFRLGLMEAIA